MDDLADAPYGNDGAGFEVITGGDIYSPEPAMIKALMNDHEMPIHLETTTILWSL